jgi:hypothetical protein
MIEEYWYWYAFHWFWTDVGKEFRATSYSGFSTNVVSKAAIKTALEQVKHAPDNALLMSVSHLGCMTREEFHNSECEIINKDEENETDS